MTLQDESSTDGSTCATIGGSTVPHASHSAAFGWSTSGAPCVTPSADVLLAKYQSKVRDTKRALSRLRLQKDAQLESIKMQLFLLESQLRKEQKDILCKLDQRDMTIASQQQEITKLRRDNRRLMNRLKKLTEDSPSYNTVSSSSTSNTCSSSEFSDASLYGTIGGHSSRLADQRRQPHQLATDSKESYVSATGSLGDLHQGGSSHLSVRVKGGGTNTNLLKSKSVEAINPNVASVRAMTDRVLHKPPIAEKPKVCTAGRVQTSLRPPQQVSPPVQQPSSRQCTIVSTISRLLDEESDGGAGSSEPSSPEATLKPQTPRVIRLARKYEGVGGHTTKQNKPNNKSSSLESLRSHERVIKALLMDELEVTSGYNSDAVSEHDYENIHHVAAFEQEQQPSALRQDDEDGYVEDDDNYVVLESMKKDDTNADVVWEVSESDDQPLYSNIQFSSTSLHSPTTPTKQHQHSSSTEQLPSGGRRQQMPLPHTVSRAKSLDDLLLETNLDSSASSLLHGSAPNTPVKGYSLQKRSDPHTISPTRCRQNINHLILKPSSSSSSDHMAENFEEFTLDSLELEGDHDTLEGSREGWGGRKGKENLVPSFETRRCGDGAEMKTEAGSNSTSSSDSSSVTHTYEKFLEATGLSQKSILTPSRVFSNHRSVLKPRDIKHRDKLRAAFTTLATLEEAPSPGQSPSKYWTEPYV